MNLAALVGLDAGAARHAGDIRNEVWPTGSVVEGDVDGRKLEDEKQCAADTKATPTMLAEPDAANKVSANQAQQAEDARGEESDVCENGEREEPRKQPQTPRCRGCCCVHCFRSQDARSSA